MPRTNGRATRDNPRVRQLANLQRRISSMEKGRAELYDARARLIHELYDDGITQQAIADLAGMHPQAVWKVLHTKPPAEAASA
jgi:hypothetical protein